MEYYSKAIHVCEQNGLRKWEATVHYRMAKEYHKNVFGNHDEIENALTHINKSISLDQKYADVRN